MSLLFAMPYWPGPSELWMERMLSSLADDLGTIACRNPATRRWQGRVPTVKLDRHVPGEQTLRRWHVPVPHIALRQLVRAGRAPHITRVLTNYAAWSVLLDSVWHRIDKPVHVFCHGYDVTWDLRCASPPFAPVHPPNYMQRVAAMSSYARFIANSQTTAARLVQAGIPADRIDLHYLGVPVPKHCPARSVKRRGLTILYLGRLVDFKGPDLTLRAFDLACSHGLDARLVMAGDGPLLTTCHLLKQQSRYGDRIELVGAVDAATGQRLRDRADIFTAHSCTGPLTRQDEAFGVAFVEAMAEGLPIATGAAGSLPEVLDDGKCGVLFEPGDVEAHAQALLDLASDPAQRTHLGEQGWQRATELYSDTQAHDSLRRIMGLGHTAPTALPLAA
jgi:colanic acid/amylovoran biosynthesis glycosyltransferase